MNWGKGYSDHKNIQIADKPSYTVKKLFKMTISNNIFDKSIKRCNKSNAVHQIKQKVLQGWTPKQHQQLFHLCNQRPPSHDQASSTLRTSTHLFALRKLSLLWHLSGVQKYQLIARAKCPCLKLCGEKRLIRRYHAIVDHSVRGFEWQYEQIVRFQIQKNQWRLCISHTGRTNLQRAKEKTRSRKSDKQPHSDPNPP